VSHANSDDRSWFQQQTAANAEQMREIEERIQSLAEVLGSPVDGRDSEEKARRGALRELVLLSDTPGYYD